MADASGPSGGGYDYVRDSTSPPSNPEEGDEWYQPDENDAKTYNETSGQWEDMRISDHTQLANVDPASHHNPVTVSGPLTEDDSQGLGLSLGDGLTISGGQLIAAAGNGLGIDGSGQVYVSADYALLSELSDHESDASIHHSRPTNTDGTSASEVTHKVVRDIRAGEYLRIPLNLHIVKARVESAPSSNWQVAGYYDDGSPVFSLEEGSLDTTVSVNQPISSLLLTDYEGSAGQFTVELTARVADHSHGVQ